AQAPPQEAARAAESSSPQATDAAAHPLDAAAAHPLSHGQRALWFLHQLDPQNPAYNITAAARILSDLDAEALRRAWQALVERHASLRTTFAQGDGEPAQYVRPHAAACFSHEDASGWGETVLSERVAAEGSRPFVLEEGPLLRVNLFTRSEREHLLLLVVHHTVADFWSLSLLVDELGRLYDAERTGGEARLAPLALNYTDYARRQAEFLDGAGGARGWAYWERQLAGAPSVLNLPTDRPRPPVQTFRGAAHAFGLDAELTRRLKEFAREGGGTLYMTLLAAFQVLLHRYTGQDDLLVGSPASGRDRAELARLVGYFINPVVLRARLGDNPSFAEFAARVRRTVLEAFEHQDYPFALLVERLQPERDASRSPLFQVMFTLQKTPGDDGAGLTAFALGEAGVRVRVGDLLLESAAQPPPAAQFDLTLMVAEIGGRLSASLRYNEDLFDEAWAARMGEHFRALLDDIVARPERRVSDLNFLTRAERRQLLRDWNDTRAPYPRGVCVHQTFEARAALAPDAVALCFRDEQLTYGELNRRADRLARQLKSRGVGPDVRVGVCLRRSAGMVVALLGVLKAGGAYVPLDPTYPKERLALMLDDARAPVLLTERPLAALLPDHGAQAIHLEDEAASNAAARDPSPTAGDGGDGGVNGINSINSIVGPDNLAYVIYTSGSTGRPKGVMVSHRNVVNFFAGMDERVGGGDGPGTWLAVTSISFDISVLELLWTLARGFRVVVQPEQSGAAYGLAERESVGRGAMDFSLFYFAAADDDAAADKYDLLMKGAAFADRNGFAAVWTPERHFHSFGGLYPNPSVIGAALAAVTERIQIRAGSVVLPLHSPVRVAEEWAVVDNLSRGRVGVSFASGWHADDFVFAPDNYEPRKELMMLHVETVRRLWRGEAVTFRGGASDVEVRIRPRPVQAELPVWITAAGHPDTFRAAGEAGANLLTHLLGQSVEELAEKIKIYRESWRPRQHGPERGRVTLMLHTFVGEDLETVRAKVRKPLSSYLATSLDLARNLLRSLGESVDGALAAADLEALLAHAFDRYYNTSGLFGTPQSCLQMINRLKSIGVDETACLIDFGVDADSTLAGLRQLNLLRQLSDAGREADEDDRTPAEQLARHNVTHMQCTPSLAGALVEDPAAAGPLGTLGKMLVGGEALPESLAARLREKVRGEIHNMYGPTETTIWSATHRLAHADDGVVPIGRPVANTEIYVLDARLQPVPVGMTGELFIGGEGVVRGYLRRPGHTSERFIPDPFGDRPGARLYRTGDLARYLPDGSVAYLGRLDQQVKVRGHRIELAEVEAALREHAGVREAAVV
ncbi:MAG TPA: MupA/Atu3671 family FMN-dependent luciferase-like monooxygenase, partial [Pyrinomonadaceae bacterium]